MKHSRITDDMDVNLDDLDPSAPGGTNGADTGDDTGDDEDQDDLPDGEEPDDEDVDSAGDDGDEDPALAADPARRQAGDEQDPPRGRANARVRALNTQLRQEREAREALQRRFDDFAAGRHQTQQQQQPETQEQRAARRSLMSAEERMSEDMASFQTEMRGHVQRTTLQTQDAADKASFDAKAASYPLYSRWAARVEAERARLASLGSYVYREAIFDYLLGRAAREAHVAKGGKTQRALAQRRVARQTTPSGNNRSDTTQSKRGRSLEDRLANVPL